MEIEKLRSMFYYGRKTVYATATLPNGRVVRGTVTGIGSKVGIRDSATDELVEDVRPEWISQATHENKTIKVQ